MVGRSMSRDFSRGIARSVVRDGASNVKESALDDLIISVAGSEYWKAFDRSTMWQTDTPDVTPVVNDNDIIALLQGQNSGGSNLDFTQSVASAEPLATTTNGYQGLYASTSNDRLQLTVPSTGQPFMFAVQSTVRSLANITAVVMAMTPAGKAEWLQVFAARTSRINAGIAVTGDTDFPGLNVTTNRIAIFDGANSEMYVDGVADEPPVHDVGANTGFTTLFLAGRDANPTHLIGQTINKIAYMPIHPDAGQIATVNNYLEIIGDG